MLSDVLMMKHFNIIAIRTCYYPNDPFWYYLCETEKMFVQELIVF